MKKLSPANPVPLIGLLAATMLAGCATVTSSHIGQNDYTATAGISYFLPRRLARVTVSRTLIQLDDAIKAVIKSKTDVDSATAAVERLKGEIRITEDSINNPNNPTGQALMQARLATLTKELETANGVLTQKTNALTTAQDNLRTVAAATPPKHGPGAYKLALKMELLAPSADPDHAFVLDPDHSWLRDDEHKLMVSPAGLLTSADTIATNRGADILVEFGNIAGALSGLQQPLVSPLPAPDKAISDSLEQKCINAPDQLISVVDFAREESFEQFNEDLSCFGLRATEPAMLWTKASSAENLPRPLIDIDLLPPPDRANVDGIVYRRPVDVLVEFERCMNKNVYCGTSDWHSSQTFELSLPQAGPISYIRQDSGFPTRSRYTLAFSDGILTSYDGNRPSEAIETAKIPLRVVNGVFDGISKVISLRIGQNNNQAALTASDMAIVNANVNLQAAQINGQRTLDEARLALLRAEQNLQGASSDTERLRLEQEVNLLRAQVALLDQQRALVTSQLALQQGQASLQAAGAAGQANAQLALLQAQTAYVTAVNNAAVQLASTQQTPDAQAQYDETRRCVLANVAAGLDIGTCLPAP